MALEVVVLAAGQGKRMRSRLPKALHVLGGAPLVTHVLRAARALGPSGIHVVVGFGAEQMRRALACERDVTLVLQQEQRGTGHAVQQAMPGIDPGAHVLVLLGDVPLVDAATLRQCAAAAAAGRIGLVTADAPDPSGLGRIVRDASGRVLKIVEERDADERVRALREINTGIIALPATRLAAYLSRLTCDNAQNELYLTDVISLAVAEGVPVEAIKAPRAEEVTGINDRIQLARMERVLQTRLAERLMEAGVTLRDPARLDIRGEVTAGEDCTIDVNVVLEGNVRLGRGVEIGACVVIKDATLGDDVIVHPHTVLDGVVVGERCEIGPFARMRPGTELAAEVKVGNFVETKKTRLGTGTKSNHFAYLGDTTTGAHCNIGAGTIVCNYDGVAKHPTSIGDHVFVGSNATLVAPLVVEDEAYVAAGSTVTSTVKRGELAVGRAHQRNVSGWVPPAKRRK